MKMKSVLSSLTVLTIAQLFLGATARAQTGGSPQETKKPVVTTITGQPVTVAFADGREAVLKTSRVQAKEPLSVNLQIFDSNCSDRRGMTCKYLTPYRNIFYFFAWTKNPDATKVGQPVRFKDKSNSDNDDGILEADAFTTGLERSLAPILTAGLDTTKIVCNDFSWLPGAQTDAPDQLTIQQWNSELMSTNPETGIDENRTASSALNLSLKKVDARTLEITKISSFASSFGSVFPLLVIGDVSNLTIKDSSKGLCSVEVKPAGLESAGAAVDDVAKSRTPREKETSLYIFGSDEQSQTVTRKRGVIADELQSLLSRLQYTQPEGLE